MHNNKAWPRLIALPLLALLPLAILAAAVSDAGWKLVFGAALAVVLSLGLLLALLRSERAARHEAERARRRLETMFAANLIGNATWRLDGSISSANDSFLASIGYTREDLAAGRISWREITPARYAEIDRARLEEFKATRVLSPYEKEYVRKDGSLVPVLVAAAFFPDSSDEGISYIVDLTEVKRAEQQARELLAQVSRNERQLREADQRKDIYLATLAHELRNPLAPIRNAAALLRLEGGDDPKVAWAQDMIERQTTQMARLLDDLLDVSRISQGKVDLRVATLDLCDALRDALDTARPLVERHRHRLELHGCDAPIWVDGDRVRLAQVFANLLANAAKYTDRGGRIRVEVAADAAHALVTVSDNGIGVEPDFLARIFEPFAQSRRTVDRAQGGVGIGLALVKGLVELHGGAVGAQSAGPGEGSVFSVRLPISRATAGPPQRAAPAPESAAGVRVLIVDDNRDAADSLARLLEAAGAEVRLAYDGITALVRAREQLPDVAILDIGMPGLDGLQVAGELRKLDRPPFLVALTGWGQESDRAAAMQAGFNRHFTKPVDPDEIFEVLRGVRLAA